MRTFPQTVIMKAVLFGAASLHAVEIVKFDAEQISTNITVSSSLVLNEEKAALNPGTGYTGQPIYRSFQEEGTSFCILTDRANAGLKLRWNPGKGTIGEAASALFLFKRPDFLNMDSGVVVMQADNDSIAVTTGFINPNNAVSETTIRLVIKDRSGFHISSAQAVESDENLALEATELPYFSYNPFTHTSTESGTIGAISVPSFTDITFVGFRLDALRGSDLSRGANVGVIRFSAQAAVIPKKVIIDAGERHQKIEGFGASGAFHINRLLHHNNSAYLADLLFKDLGLDIFRIRNVYGHQGYADDVENTVRTVRLGEAALGRPLKILMSAWSPPAELKSNDDDKNGGTLKKNNDGNYLYTEYADWWAESLNYYRTQGISPAYISIQNEPDWSAAYQSCRFDPAETEETAGYNKAFEAVWRKLAISRGTIGMPRMLGPEPISFNRLNDYISHLKNHERIYGFAHHLYNADVGNHPAALLDIMQETRNIHGHKPLFQTEYAVLKDNTNSAIARKLNLARLMYNALTIEEVAAYFYWGLYWDGEQGLIDLPDTASYNITPEYYAFKHYSAFVDADWRRIETESAELGIDLSAYISPDGDALSVIILNRNTNPVTLDLRFTNVTVSAGSVFHSTTTQDCVHTGSFDPTQPIEAPAESITTLSLPAIPPAAPKTPNILMICIDDLRPEIRSYGALQMITPNIDRFASDGYQFNRAYVQQAVCSPSRTSVLTGMRPDSTRVFDLTTHFRDTIPWVETLPQYLKRYGYHSAGLGKIYHGNLNDALSWDEPWSSGDGLYSYILQENINIRNEHGQGPPTEKADVADNVYRDGAVTDQAIVKLRELTTRQPFFYAIGYVRPHLPFIAPKTYWDLYTTNDLVRPYTDRRAVDASSFAYTSWGELRGYYGIPVAGPVSEAQEIELIHGYYASVSYVDAQLGRLIDALEAEGLAENTIVIVWGDHGWHLGNQDQWTKHTNFERATRIPLLIKVPWMPGASQIDALIEAVDIYPTLLELCGISFPPHLEGKSLAPLLKNPSDLVNSAALSQYPRKAHMGYSLRTDRYRYTQWYIQNSNVLVEHELYDHFLDPGEDTNVVAHAAYAVEVSMLASQLETARRVHRRQGTSTGEQLIANGGFDHELNNWSLTKSGSAEANFNILSNEEVNGLDIFPLLHIEINQGTSEKHRLAIRQTVPARPNRIYTIRFMARTAAKRDITLLWRNKYNKSAPYLNLSVPIGTQSRMYEFTHIRPANLNGSDEDGELRIQFGGHNADVWIDSVEMYAQTSFTDALKAAGLSGADALPDADADRDLVPNFLEYACNLDMTLYDRQTLLPGIGVSGLPAYQLFTAKGFQTLTLEYLRRKGAGDILYLPQFTGNLAEGIWTSGAYETVVPIDSDWERVTVRDTLTTESATRRFGRVRIQFFP